LLNLIILLYFTLFKLLILKEVYYNYIATYSNIHLIIIINLKFFFIS